MSILDSSTTGLNGQETPVIKAPVVPAVSPELSELPLELKQPYEIVFRDGDKRMVYPGYICLNCVYPQCKCGSPRWGKLSPILAKEKPHHKKKFTKKHAYEMLEFARWFYLENIKGGSSISDPIIQPNAIQARVLMELLGYDGNHITQIIAGWEADYKAQLEAARR